jgi:hypothetical protein
MADEDNSDESKAMILKLFSIPKGTQINEDILMEHYRLSQYLQKGSRAEYYKRSSTF